MVRKRVVHNSMGDLKWIKGHITSFQDVCLRCQIFQVSVADFEFWRLKIQKPSRFGEYLDCKVSLEERSYAQIPFPGAESIDRCCGHSSITFSIINGRLFKKFLFSQVGIAGVSRRYSSMFCTDTDDGDVFIMFVQFCLISTVQYVLYCTSLLARAKVR